MCSRKNKQRKKNIKKNRIIEVQDRKYYRKQEVTRGVNNLHIQGTRTLFAAHNCKHTIGIPSYYISLVHIKTENPLS